MQFQQIAPNLYIPNSLEFGDYDHRIVHDLLISIDINFSSALKIAPFTSRKCYICYRPENLMCCFSPFDGSHYILLYTGDNLWCQWVYQFAHEYCHHLIDGKLTGEISGLSWFEETICELSSLYHLNLLNVQWSKSDNHTQRQYAPVFQGYLRDLLSENHQLLSELSHPGWLSSWLPILSEPIHHRDHYNAMASKMFPLFVANPSLWKIILHIGDSRKWSSLQELFDHLFDKAEPDYDESLRDLYKMLFY